jgi:methionine synthase I (cobalamin-dependent)
MTTSARKQELIHKLKNGLLIGDGGLGTTLRGDGIEPGECEELLNVNRPDQVRAAHRGFLEAGSDIITANTFQGNPISLDRKGLSGRTDELNAAGAALALEVAGDRAFVAGSIGPTGMLLKPYGDFEPDEARAAFASHAQALAASGVDFLIVETFGAIEEVVLAVAAAADTGLPVVASLAFGLKGRTPFGVTAEQAAQECGAAGATVVGANCGTISPDEMLPIIAQFRDATSLPLIAQPNAGRPEATDTGAIYPETPEGMADAAERFRELGATIIGGCCGTTPDHIRAIAARLRGA